jgi:transglutaminase-like putative cysteine protease
MTIYAIRHLTTYRYDSEVSYARCELRLTPGSDEAQTVLKSQIEVTPLPASRTAKTDVFGATVTALIIDKPHRSLAIESRCLVDVHAPPIGDVSATDPWETVRIAALKSRALDANAPAVYLYPTPTTPITPQITAYARESFTPGRPVLEAAAELMGRIRKQFSYDPEATDVRTPVLEAFEKRHGVCQDFAHVMICGLRGLGLPARYVSGYLRTIPAPGQARLEGADATHAWVALWCGPQRGWVGLDPTNDLLVGNDHVRLAVGRDYRDVAPIEGVLLGAGRQTLDVAVDVLEASQVPVSGLPDSLRKILA